MASTPGHLNLITYNLTPPDLNSASATKTPAFTFPDPENPLILLSTANALAVCMHIKSWLLRQHDEPAYSSPGILRMEYLALEKIERGNEGWVLFAPEIAKLENKGAKEEGLRVSIVAVLIKGDSRVRWFYTLPPPVRLLEHLDYHKLIRLRDVLEPADASQQRFRRLHVWLRECFARAIKFPDSPDWLHAQGISDFCPSILDPDTAVSRLQEESWIYWNTPKPEESLLPPAAPQDAPSGKERAKDISTLTTRDFDPSDDRYLHDLHPAERELASLARLKCAEYLFLKRNFFRAFWEEVYRSDKIADMTAPESTSNPVVSRRLGAHPGDQATNAASTAAAGSRQDTPFSVASTPAPEGTPGRARARGVGFDRSRRTRVRTERAHQAWLENEYKCKVTQARTLVVGWRVLGFLDEARFMDWVTEGWGADGADDNEDWKKGG